MKKLFFISVLLIVVMAIPSFSRTIYIDPTGTYQLISKTKKIRSDTFGRTGTVQIKPLSKNRIVIVLGINMGAPAYNSGIIIDTVGYKNNQIIYKPAEYDKSCLIILHFTKTGITITQKQADPNFACGFGHGVFCDGFYQKQTAKIPVLRDPNTDELIK